MQHRSEKRRACTRSCNNVHSVQVFKSGGRDGMRARARLRHTALADALLRHIIDHEMGALADESSDRAKAVMSATELVCTQLQNSDHFTDVRHTRSLVACSARALGAGLCRLAGLDARCRVSYL